MRGRFVHEVHIIYLSPPDLHWPQQHHPGHDCDNDYSNIQQHHDDQGTTAAPSTTDKDAVDATSFTTAIEYILLTNTHHMTNANDDNRKHIHLALCKS